MWIVDPNSPYWYNIHSNAIINLQRVKNDINLDFRLFSIDLGLFNDRIFA